MTQASSAPIEYFYSAHSAFAYVGSARFMDIARSTGRSIVHKPYDLRRGIEAATAASFSERSQAHMDYFFRREIERWAEHRNVPVMQGTPTHHHHDILPSNTLVIAAVQQGIAASAVDALAHALLERHWRDDADLADADTLADIVGSVGIDPASLFEASASPEVRNAYEANTAEAIERSVFGSPTYFVDGDMFYGQDHLELVERALVKPYAGKWG